MLRFLQAVFVAVGIVVVGVFAFALLGGTVPSLSPTGAGVPSGSHHAYSNEQIDVYQIVKNPYVLEGQAGILDPHRGAMFSSDGRRYPVNYPNSLQFDKMLDEHTALFDVRAGYESYGQLAVTLEGSDPPEATRPWAIYVESPMEGTNAFGATVKVTQVKFEGYASLSTPDPTGASPAPAAAQEEPKDPALVGAGSAETKAVKTGEESAETSSAASKMPDK